jgi:hypothetical protein
MNRNSLKWYLVEGPLHMTSHYTKGSMTTLHDLEVSWDGLWTPSFGLLACVWSGPQVPNPTHARKSQHGGKISTCEPRVTIKIWLINIKVKYWVFYEKIVTSLGWELRPNFYWTQLATHVPSLTSKKCMLLGRHPCHNWGLGLGTPCEVVSPNFHH